MEYGRDRLDELHLELLSYNPIRKEFLKDSSFKNSAMVIMNQELRLHGQYTTNTKSLENSPKLLRVYSTITDRVKD